MATASPRAFSARRGSFAAAPPVGDTGERRLPFAAGGPGGSGDSRFRPRPPVPKRRSRRPRRRCQLRRGACRRFFADHCSGLEGAAGRFDCGFGDRVSGPSCRSQTAIASPWEFTARSGRGSEGRHRPQLLERHGRAPGAAGLGAAAAWIEYSAPSMLSHTAMASPCRVDPDLRVRCLVLCCLRSASGACHAPPPAAGRRLRSTFCRCFVEPLPRARGVALCVERRPAALRRSARPPTASSGESHVGAPHRRGASRAAGEARTRRREADPGCIATVASAASLSAPHPQASTPKCPRTSAATSRIAHCSGSGSGGSTPVRMSAPSESHACSEPWLPPPTCAWRPQSMNS